VVVAAIIAQAAPLAACLGILLFLRRHHRAAAALAIGALAAATMAATYLVATIALPNESITVQSVWLPIEGSPGLSFGIMLDTLSTGMALVVAAVTLLVMLYSLGYMKGDPGFARYYGFLALFAWAMMALVLASNLLQTLVFWELVGLASFLLIGFWFEKPAPAAAARKAFIMTRVGDVGFMLGVLLLIREFGNVTIPDLLIQAPRFDSGFATLIAGLLLMGVIGKSAQGPLFTWLPDAMEGPTPVSALLHSATMVAAGVYLVARLHGVFMAAPAVMTALLWCSVITALVAATMAMVADDIKRVLAYSSISQLAYMLMALAAGSVAAGFFHLVTHAGFKALLFMAAGVFIHHAHSNDMRAINAQGGAPKPGVIGLWAGALALAGVIPFAGYFSKEAVLAALGEHAGTVALALAYAGAGLTAYYSFRMVWLTTGRTDGPSDRRMEAHGEHHGAEATMAIPVLVLAALTLALGWLGGFFATRLSPDEVHHGALAFGAGPATALGLAAAGIALAWLEFGRHRAARVGFVERMPALRAFFADNWYLDRLYNATFVRAGSALSRLALWHDQKVLDGAGDGLGAGTVAGGRLLAFLQSGYVQMYIAVAVSVMAALGFFLLRQGGVL
jgi:NADH-quinone oxidoreductase subunit L